MICKNLFIFDMSLDKFGRKSSRNKSSAIPNIEQQLNNLFDYKVKAIKSEVDSLNVNLHKEIDDLSKITLENNRIININPPTAGKHLATKKYVDDAIVVAKSFLRADLKSAQADLEKNLKNKNYDLNVNLMQLAQKIINFGKELESIKQKIK